MKSQNKENWFYQRCVITPIDREEENCSHCSERFHISELVNLNEKYDNLNYCSLVCVPCQKGIHLVVEAKTILKK